LSIIACAWSRVFTTSGTSEVNLSSRKTFDAGFNFLRLGMINGAIVDDRVGASAERGNQERKDRRAVQSLEGDHDETILAVIGARGTAAGDGENYSVIMTAE